MTETKPKRRWFRFSLRMLFVLVTVTAIVSAWYGRRLLVLNAERARISGRWWQGDELSGYIQEFSEADFDLEMPHDGIGRIDFHMKLTPKVPDGTWSNISHGIYRFDGDKIEVAQSNPGEPRPLKFEKSKGTNVWSAKRIGPFQPKP